MYNVPTYNSQFYLPDWVEERVIACRSNKLITDLVDAGTISDGYPIFRTGYWNELKQIHSNAVNAGTNKYPCIYVPIQYEEDHNLEDGFDINYSIFIMMASGKKYSSEKRLDDVVKTVLNPIYKAFLDEVKNNEWVFNTDTRYPEHVRQNLIFDQSQNEGQNQLNEVIEAIQITFNPLTFINKMNN